MCFVETMNLDGETNLKHKQADKNVIKLSKDIESCCANLGNARIECETPNALLYKFEGNLHLQNGEVIPMGTDQILLRGSSLRNTEWVYGVCIFTGHETKIMKNGTNARAKTSKIAKQTNIYIIVTMVFQLVLSLVASIITSLWTYFEGDKCWYIYPTGDNEDISLPLFMLQQTGVWFIALMNFVPISLLVTLEMINFIQAYFISVDIEVCD